MKKYSRDGTPIQGLLYRLGCANKDLWGLCAPIFIIVVYSRTATSYFCTSSGTRIFPELRNLRKYPSTTASTGITL